MAKLQPYEPNAAGSEPTLVVVKINNFDYLDIRRISNNSQENNKSIVNNDEFRILKSSYFFKPFTYANTIYSIEPGTYYISFIAIDSEQGVYYSEAPGIDVAGSITYGAFEIKPGEVLYLGDLECQWRSTNKVKKFIAHSNFVEVQKDLSSAGLSKIAAQIQPRKLIPAGSKLDITTE
ncbi:hypothetical protein KC939_02900 [Candidatus Saccharibacteria bacterium]|nr:hypothetical protein [Candidatus Saccharibacteria bacterium]